jgi:hypothetical protein
MRSRSPSRGAPRRMAEMLAVADPTRIQLQTTRRRREANSGEFPTFRCDASL